MAKAKETKKDEIEEKNEVMTKDEYENLIVQKCFPLFELWRSDYGLVEFKLLDMYLGRINSHDISTRTVRIEKGELEKILQVKRIRSEELDKRLKTLCTPIRVDDNATILSGKTDKNNKKAKKFVRLSLFEKAVAEQDEDGLWQIELTCTQSAIKYFFNIDNLGYLRYGIRCISKIKSRYAYIMFMYIESHRNMNEEWQIDLDKLKYILNCEDEETYKEYRRFNDRLLKRVHSELEEKTECVYKYLPVKLGRKIVAIKFILAKNSKVAKTTKKIDKPKNEVKKGASQLDQRSIPSGESILNAKVEEVKEVKEVTVLRENAETLMARTYEARITDALKQLNLTDKEIDVINEKLNDLPHEAFPVSLNGEDINARRYKYIKNKVKVVLVNDEKKTIKNKCQYLLKMIEQDERRAINKINKMAEETIAETCVSELIQPVLVVEEEPLSEESNDNLWIKELEKYNLPSNQIDLIKVILNETTKDEETKCNYIKNIVAEIDTKSIKNVYRYIAKKLKEISNN